jgi:hypothetical protein
LADLIRDEYSLTTGDDLILHTDRTTTEWSAEWRDRVHDGPNATTFLIPIITPRYFRQPECRAELVDFTTRARNLGLAAQVLPIVYTHTRELADPGNDDAAVALVRRMRHEKWHDLRTDDESSPAHRRAVCRIAGRLATIALRHNESTPELGQRPLDVVGALAEAVPRWGQAFTMLDNAMGRIDALTEKLLLELANTPFDDGNAIGRLAVLRTYADEIMKPARDVLALGNAFAAEVIQLDPSILALLARPARENDFADHCRALVLATEQLRHTAEAARDYGAQLATIAGLSEILDDPVGDVAMGVRSVLDGTALIGEWQKRITSPGGQTE